MSKIILVGEITFLDPCLGDKDFKAIVHSIDEVFNIDEDNLKNKLDEIEDNQLSYLVKNDYQFDVEFECKKPQIF